MILPVLIAMVAGWLQQHQQQVITYLLRKIASSKPGSWPPAAPDGHGTPSPRDACPPTRPPTPQGGGNSRDARYPHALVPATDRPEV